MFKSAESFLKNVNNLMNQAGMRAADLARAMGMSPQQLSAYLNEGRTPSLEVLDRFALALETTPGALLGSAPPSGIAVETLITRQLLERAERSISAAQKELQALRARTNAIIHNDLAESASTKRLNKGFEQLPGKPISVESADPLLKLIAELSPADRETLKEFIKLRLKKRKKRADQTG